MTLEEYKRKYNLTNADLSQMFKVSEPTIHRWIYRKVTPREKHMARILMKTNQEVGLKEMQLSGKVRHE